MTRNNERMKEDWRHEKLAHHYQHAQTKTIARRFLAPVHLVLAR